MIGHIADPVVDNKQNFNIFFNEALTILVALQWASSLNPTPLCIAIHMDSNAEWSGIERGSPLQGNKDSEGFIKENVEVLLVVHNRVSNMANHQGCGPESKC